MMIKINRRQVSPWRSALLELVNEGVLNKDQLIVDLVNWMSESDCAEFCDAQQLPILDD